MTFPLSQMKKNQYAHQDLIHNQQMLPTPHPHLDPHHDLQGLDREDQAEEAPEVEEEEGAAINFLIDKTLFTQQFKTWGSMYTNRIKKSGRLLYHVMKEFTPWYLISAEAEPHFNGCRTHLPFYFCSNNGDFSHIIYLHTAQVFSDNFFQALRAYIDMYMKET